MPETYTRHRISDKDGDLMVDVFKDGGIHIYSDEDHCGEQISLIADEVEALYRLLHSLKTPAVDAPANNVDG